MHEVAFDLLILLEVAEIRVHVESPLANKTLANSDVQAETGVHIVGQWVDDALHASPADDQVLQPGMILVAVGSPDSLKRLSQIVRPITQEGAIVVRNYGPDVPIIACAATVENVGRIQQAGADFALSVIQVAGQLLAHHVLGEMVSQQARIKLGKLDVGRLVGRHSLESAIRERTGCAVVAVERTQEVIMDTPRSFVLTETDALYVCGAVDAFNGSYEAFTQSHG